VKARWVEGMWPYRATYHIQNVRRSVEDRRLIIEATVQI
jgi:hypothetical protein